MEWITSSIYKYKSAKLLLCSWFSTNLCGHVLWWRWCWSQGQTLASLHHIAQTDRRACRTHIGPCLGKKTFIVIWKKALLGFSILMHAEYFSKWGMLENYLSRICLDIFDHPSFLRNTHLQCWLICLRQSLAWASLIFSLMIAGQREPKKMENSKGQRGGLYHGTVVDAAATKSKHHFETQGAANRPVEPSLRCTSPFELDRFLIFLRVCMCLCVCVHGAWHLYVCPLVGNWGLVFLWQRWWCWWWRSRRAGRSNGCG